MILLIFLNQIILVNHFHKDYFNMTSFEKGLLVLIYVSSLHRVNHNQNYYDIHHIFKICILIL